MTAPTPPNTPGVISTGQRWNDTKFAQADGNNGFISYPQGQIGIRVKKVEWSWVNVYTESHARAIRAMYPHQRAPGTFAITLQLKGYAEYKAFMNFMMGYIRSFAMFSSTDLPGLQYAMTVSVPVRSFSRVGIPVSGIADTDHVGSMLFEPTIVFEAMEDPLDPTIYSPQSGSVSQADNSAPSPQSQFFYPFSSGSEDASVIQDSLLYDTQQKASQGVNSLIDSVTQANRNPFQDGVGGTGGNIGMTSNSGIPGSPF